MKPDYDPGPCPVCGSPNPWDYPADSDDPDTNPDHWNPGVITMPQPGLPVLVP